jgi:hypothetical protein
MTNQAGNQFRQKKPEDKEYVPSLKGLVGRFRLEIAGEPRAIVDVRDGTVTFDENMEGSADAVGRVDNEEDLLHILEGHLNPVVAVLQNRLLLDGNVGFAARLIESLRAGSPFHGQRLRAQAQRQHREA